jgi:hypothetical protein
MAADALQWRPKRQFWSMTVDSGRCRGMLGERGRETARMGLNLRQCFCMAPNSQQWAFWAMATNSPQLRLSATASFLSTPTVAAKLVPTPLDFCVSNLCIASMGLNGPQ